jgi:hypothetical protein
MFRPASLRKIGWFKSIKAVQQRLAPDNELWIGRGPGSGGLIALVIQIDDALPNNWRIRIIEARSEG